MKDQLGMQNNIRAWWEENPMTYDWRNTNPYREGTPEWFANVDRIFFDRVSSFFANATGAKPFSKLIPYKHLYGKEVLEIGCGSGAHARLITEEGARLTAVDLTEKAIKLTQTRLSLAGLTADIHQMDARNLSFEDGRFDFVWSWGVINHSEDTEQIIKEIARVLRPGGEARIMVYHRRSINVLRAIFLGASTGKLFREGLNRTLAHYSDGLIAKFYTREQLAGLFQPHFSHVSTKVVGQKNELIPIPGSGFMGKFKSRVALAIPELLAASILSRWGGFLFLAAKK